MLKGQHDLLLVHSNVDIVHIIIKPKSITHGLCFKVCRARHCSIQDPPLPSLFTDVGIDPVGLFNQLDADGDGRLSPEECAWAVSVLLLGRDATIVHVGRGVINVMMTLCNRESS